MTHIKIEQHHVDDARWVDAGGDAFAIHVAALTWCDQQTTDGRIPSAMARRVSLAVDPAAVDAAIAVLVERGFWRADGDSYLIGDYESHGLLSEEIESTRARWAADQRRRRRHGNGDHSLCTEPRFCPAIRDGSNVSADTPTDAPADSAGESRTNTRPNQTIPNKTRPLGRGVVGGGGASARSAGATRAPRPKDDKARDFTFTMPEVDR